MKKLLWGALFVTVGYQGAFAQGLLQQQFGSGANAFTMDFVTIGNPNNAPDTTGYGSVAYSYNLGKYEVSREMINKANSAEGLGITLFDMTNYGGNGVNRPATGISWYDAAKFVNYLNTVNGYQAAYRFGESGNMQLWEVGQYSGSNQFRNKDAVYFLPSNNEWYKAAFYDSQRTGADKYWNFPTSSDDAPTPVSGGLEGAVYDRQSGPSDVTSAGTLGPWGTMGQGGNVWEWTETAKDGINNAPTEERELRGGDFFADDGGVGYFMAYDSPNYSRPSGDYLHMEGIGFRVASTASIPEPSSLSLLLAGVTVLMARRRAKQ